MKKEKKGIDFTKDNLYDGIGRPDLKPKGDKESILELRDGESYTVPESDYGKCEIWLKHDRYFLFEIAVFGGDVRFSESFEKGQIDKMIETYNKWN